MRSRNLISPYSTEYYLTDCEGFIQFNNSKGKVLGKRLKKIFSQAAPKAGMRILDVGCGRGELALNCGLSKAHTWGIDSSEDAIGICIKTRALWKKDYPWIEKYVQFIHGDVCSWRFEEKSFDLILLSDIVEHLEPPRLKKMLAGIAPALKTDGKVIIHTSPNKYYIPVTGRLFSFISKGLYLFSDNEKNPVRRLPWDIRKILPAGLQKDIHVNEQSSIGLKRALKNAGFKVDRIWFELNPHYMDALFSDTRGFRIINFLKKNIPIKHLFYADLFCIARI